jgi:facilitated trehalose transporter
LRVLTIVFQSHKKTLHGSVSPLSEKQKTECQIITFFSYSAAILVVVGPFASFSCGFIMEKIGRLNTIKIAAFPAITGWIVIATANSVYPIMVGRILIGLGCSKKMEVKEIKNKGIKLFFFAFAAWGTSPAVVYITEVARPDLRGSLLTSCPSLASLGMVIALVTGAYLDWRMVSWLSLIYTIVPIVILQFFVPESPVWLVSKGRREEATKSLEILYRKYPQPQHTVMRNTIYNWLSY